jgi:hypothetical protein
VNRNTVRRAYLELQQEGSLLLRQGKEAEVASRAARPPRKPPRSQSDVLARDMIRDLESRGIDGVQFAAILERAAADHDALYPKCVFVECSRAQADDLARATQSAWHRRVIGVDLNALRRDADAMPRSARYVLTTHWHLAEVKKTLKGRSILIREVRVVPSEKFGRAVRALAGPRTGLLIRDPESVPGYRKLVEDLRDSGGTVDVALVGDEEAALGLIRSVQSLIYTAPCRGFVQTHAPKNLDALELLCEPQSDELVQLAEELFGS